MSRLTLMQKFGGGINGSPRFLSFFIRPVVEARG
jgi:hypothetical protein